MRRLISLIIFAILLMGNTGAQPVTLKQIGKETVMFTSRFVEWYNQNLYTIDNTGALYKTDLNTGTKTRLGKVTYNDTRFLFIVNGQLYCLENDGSMNRIDIYSGAWTVVSAIGTWSEIERVMVVGRKFYTTQNGALYYHPTMTDKVKTQIGDADFFDLGHYFKTDTSVHTLVGGSLYNINLTSGKWKMITPKKGWKNVMDGEVIGNKLYSIETPSSLWVTDLSTGTRKLLDDSQFLKTELIFSDSGKLYIIASGGVLYEIIIGPGSN